MKNFILDLKIFQSRTCKVFNFAVNHFEIYCSRRTLFQIQNQRKLNRNKVIRSSINRNFVQYALRRQACVKSISNLSRLTLNFNLFHSNRKELHYNHFKCKQRLYHCTTNTRILTEDIRCATRLA